MIPRFRYWDEYEQKMYNNSRIVIWDGSAYQNEWKKIFDRFIGGKKGLVGSSLHDDYLMQSAGLMDKNGVEIFEGDIIRIDGGEYGDDIAVVDFVDGGFFADYHDLVTEFELLHSIALPIEIIGNVYENRNLLEGKAAYE